MKQIKNLAIRILIISILVTIVYFSGYTIGYLDGLDKDEITFVMDMTDNAVLSMSMVANATIHTSLEIDRLSSELYECKLEGIRMLNVLARKGNCDINE